MSGAGLKTLAPGAPSTPRRLPGPRTAPLLTPARWSDFAATWRRLVGGERMKGASHLSLLRASYALAVLTPAMIQRDAAAVVVELERSRGVEAPPLAPSFTLR